MYHLTSHIFHIHSLYFDQAARSKTSKELVVHDFSFFTDVHFSKESEKMNKLGYDMNNFYTIGVSVLHNDLKK